MTKMTFQQVFHFGHGITYSFWTYLNIIGLLSPPHGCLHSGCMFELWLFYHCCHGAPNHSCSTYPSKGNSNPAPQILKWSWWALSVHVILYFAPKEEIKWCKVRRSWKPLNVVSQSDNSVWKQFLQSIANCQSPVAGSTILKEPHSANGTIALTSKRLFQCWSNILF